MNGVRVYRQNWLFFLLALLAVVTFPVFGLLYTLYFFGCFCYFFIDAIGKECCSYSACNCECLCDCDDDVWVFARMLLRILLSIILITVGGLGWVLFLSWFLLKIYFRGILLSIFYVPFKFAFVPVTREL